MRLRPLRKPLSRIMVATIAVAAVVVPASASIPDTPDGALASPRVTVSGGVGGPVADVAVSGSGRYVVFDSPADDFYPGEPNDPAGTTCEVFRRDLLTDTTILVSQSATGTVGGGCSSHPAVDYDGNVIAS